MTKGYLLPTFFYKWQKKDLDVAMHGLSLKLREKGVIKVLKQLFIEHVIPASVISDSGHKCSTEAFFHFVQQWSFN